MSRIWNIIHLYDIKVPKKVDKISYNKELKDRGGTFLLPNGHYEVELGPEAFISDQVLASTLGHELEVHAQQAYDKNLLTREESECRYEIEAYNYELREQKRFGTNKAHIDGVKYFKDLYEKKLLEKKMKITHH